MAWVCGASLVVDGQLGPRTAAAIHTYQLAHGLPSPYVAVQELVGSGLDHPIEVLFGGHWFWEFECGYLFGILDLEC